MGIDRIALGAIVAQRGLPKEEGALRSDRGLALRGGNAVNRVWEARLNQ